LGTPGLRRRRVISPIQQILRAVVLCIHILGGLLIAFIFRAILLRLPGAVTFVYILCLKGPVLALVLHALRLLVGFVFHGVLLRLQGVVVLVAVLLHL
jgi:hypothetical protein